MSNIILEILQERRVMALLFILLLAISWIFVNGGPFNGGLKFGIDFSGGLRVPVLLEQPVDSVTMGEMVDTIKARASTFALTEVRVRPVGDSEIYVEVAKTNSQLLSEILQILSQQGVFTATVDGQVAVQGSDVLTQRIYRVTGSQLAQSGGDWAISFSVTPQGETRFTTAAKGKTNYPIYMFVDRPTDAIIVISKADLLAQANVSTVAAGNIRQADALKATQDAMKLNGHNITIYLEEDLISQGENLTLKPFDNQTQAILSSNASSALISKLNASGFVMVMKKPVDMQPHYRTSNGAATTTIVDSWTAVGLNSAPSLTADVTQGVPSSFNSYVINGPATGLGNARVQDADRRARETMAVLKGGALPVQISVGQVQEVQAPLGAEFLRLSVIGAAFAMLCISFMVALRYRTLKVVLPIVFISVSEVIILVAIIGSFSIDLAAMAGIISAIGVSVDAQIVVTDEILKKGVHEDAHERLNKAFAIIVTNALVAAVAMLPLLFSGLIDVIGFATSTILGYVLGVLITRPAYGSIVQHLVHAPDENKGFSGGSSGSGNSVAAASGQQKL